MERPKSATVSPWQDEKDLFQDLVIKKQEALRAKRARLRKYSQFSQDEEARKKQTVVTEHREKVRRASVKTGIPTLTYQVRQAP